MKAIFTHSEVDTTYTDGLVPWSGYGGREHMAYGMSLSVMLAAEHYDPVLCTSPEKWESFFKPLGLPFEDVRLVDFGELKGAGRWRSRAQLIGMRHFGPPFVYLHNDVFLRDPLPSFDRVLFPHAQPFERHNIYDRPVYVAGHFADSLNPPEVWDPAVHYGYRTGIVGCKDKEWHDRWIQVGLEWMQLEGLNALKESYPSCHFPILFTRHLAACVAEEIGEPKTLAGGRVEYARRTSGRATPRFVQPHLDDTGGGPPHPYEPVAPEAEGQLAIADFTGSYKQATKVRKQFRYSLEEEYPAQAEAVESFLQD